jgi:hypothetical protein
MGKKPFFVLYAYIPASPTLMSLLWIGVNLSTICTSTFRSHTPWALRSWKLRGVGSPCRLLLLPISIIGKPCSAGAPRPWLSWLRGPCCIFAYNKGLLKNAASGVLIARRAQRTLRRFKLSEGGFMKKQLRHSPAWWANHRVHVIAPNQPAGNWQCQGFIFLVLSPQK